MANNRNTFESNTIRYNSKVVLWNGMSGINQTRSLAPYLHCYVAGLALIEHVILMSQVVPSAVLRVDICMCIYMYVYV
jgi:hypothetical protein